MDKSGLVADADSSNHINCVRAVFADGTVVDEQYCCCTGMPSDGAEANIVAAVLQALRLVKLKTKKAVGKTVPYLCAVRLVYQQLKKQV